MMMVARREIFADVIGQHASLLLPTSFRIKSFGRRRGRLAQSPQQGQVSRLISSLSFWLPTNTGPCANG
jgi:hypothetical protein